MAETDVTNSVLPPDSDPPEPEDELAILEQQLDVRDDLIIGEEEPPPFGRSWSYDWGVNRFVPSTTGGPLETRGLETLRGWIVKCLQTERGSSPILPDDYGMDGPNDLIGFAFGTEAVNELRLRVEDALTMHPRIDAVKDFVAEHDPDDEWVSVAFTAVLDDESELALEGVSL